MAQMLSTYPTLRWGLPIGIGGGVPGKADIRLGDVVVGKPTGNTGGVVQYDFGKTVGGRGLECTGVLNKPPQLLLTALSQVETKYMMGKSHLALFMKEALDQHPEIRPRFARPNLDWLFNATYEHPDMRSECEMCDKEQLVDRSPRSTDNPRVHYGIIASGNQNKDWQCYAALAAPAYAKELARTVNMLQPHKVDENEDRFHVPLDLNYVPATSQFVGRTAELEELWKRLRPDVTSMRKVIVLHGLGGIGKTQLAIQFARLRKSNFSAILWLNGKTKGQLMRSIASFFPKVREKREQIQQTKAKLNESRDNNAYNVAEFFPNADNGSIVVTTRLSVLRGKGESYPMRKLQLQASELLIRSTGLEIGTGDIVDAGETLVGILPLAIVIAGSFIQETGISVSKYQELYSSSWRDLQEATSPSKSYSNGSLVNVASNELRFYKAVQELLRFSLLQPVRKLQSYFMHPVVQDWCQDMAQDNEELDDIVLFALYSLASSIPGSTEPEYWILQRRLLAHVDRRGRWGIMHDEKLLAQVHKIGLLYTDQSKFKAAEGFYQKLLELEKQPLGTDHPHTLQTVHAVGNVWRELGKLPHSEAMLQRALAGYSLTTSPNSAPLSTPAVIRSLGDLHRSQGKLKEPRSMYAKALTGYETSLGLNHPSAISATHALGNMHRDLGELGEAESKYLSALDRSSALRGLTHISCLSLYHTLGNTYRNQERNTEAEEMYQRAYTGYFEGLGPNHFSTLSMLHALGNDSRVLRKLAEAETRYKAALSGRMELYGGHHPLTLDIVHDLGILHTPLREL
ncbi:hypothetical protein BDW62DRAFT_199316 [Aspergillus aurantiobrunneus]